MKLGLPISFFGHGAALFGGVILLPIFYREPDLPEMSTLVPAELVSLAEIGEHTSLPASVEEPAEPEPEPEEAEPEPEEAEPEPVSPPPPPPPPPPAAEPEPVPAPPEPEDEAEPTPEEPEEAAPEEEEPELSPVPTPKPKPEPPEEQVDSFMANLNQLAELVDTSRDDDESTRIERPADEGADAGARGVDEGFRLTIRDAINSHVLQGSCWNPPMGAPYAERLIVNVRVRLNQDGTLDGPPEILGGAASSPNQFMRVAADEARRAVIRCEPYSFLPADRYEDWQEITMTFDPRVLGRGF